MIRIVDERMAVKERKPENRALASQTTFHNVALAAVGFGRRVSRRRWREPLRKRARIEIGFGCFHTLVGGSGSLDASSLILSWRFGE